MTDYDPETDPEAKEEWDAYVQWCADELMLFVHNPDTPRTYRTAYTCAAKLLVICGAQLRLEESVPDYEVRALNLAGLVTAGRTFERARPGACIRKAILARAVLDCWEPVGRAAPELLEAAKDAASALLITMAHPLENPWGLDAPDVWSLVLLGVAAIERIESPPQEADYMITVNTTVTDLMYFQKASNISRAMGGGDVSPN
jgi:hypothetical protein